MKIEIDLNAILGDEYGAESLQDSVRRQVIDSVTATIKKGVGDKIDQAVSSTISAEISTYLTGALPTLLAEIMEAEYIPVGRYGDRQEPTSFRKQLVKTITENMTYVPKAYSSEKNAFTLAVDEVVQSHLKVFKAKFQKKVDADYTAYAMAYATEALKKKLGIV
jgi:hypothetical protein